MSLSPLNIYVIMLANYHPRHRHHLLHRHRHQCLRHQEQVTVIFVTAIQSVHTISI